MDIVAQAAPAVAAAVAAHLVRCGVDTAAEFISAVLERAAEEVVAAADPVGLLPERVVSMLGDDGCGGHEETKEEECDVETEEELSVNAVTKEASPLVHDRSVVGGHEETKGNVTAALRATFLSSSFLILLLW